MTINSPDDIGAATAAPVDLEPITNTRDVDWLRSLTEKRTERTPLTEAKVSIKHTAYFGIRPGSVLDIAAEYSRTAHFEPSFLYAEWRDGGWVSQISDTAGTQYKTNFGGEIGKLFDSIGNWLRSGTRPTPPGE